jgi:hypothetical protein
MASQPPLTAGVLMKAGPCQNRPNDHIKRGSKFFQRRKRLTILMRRQFGLFSQGAALPALLRVGGSAVESRLA